MTTLNKLEPSKRKKGRWLCHLSDGNLLRVSENEVVAFALYSGKELEEETLEALQKAAEKSKTRDTALNLVSLRPLSRKELVKKLLEREVPEDEAEETAQWLTSLGLLNDESYAVQVVRHYSAKGCGKRKIQEELYRRGVPREYWEAAMEEREDPAEAVDAFLAKKLGDDSAPDRKTLQKVSNALARKGFSWSEISDGLRRRKVEIPDD